MKNEYFIVYETTNLINGKKYRGIHRTKNLNDRYLGSGFAFKCAIRKYGEDNFKKEILEFCNSYNELLEREKFYVDDDWIKDKNTYNLKTGGQSAGILSEESKKKISETLKTKYKNGEIIANSPACKKGKKGWNKGVKMPEKYKKLCSKVQKERFKNDDNHPFKICTNRIPHNKGKKLKPLSEEQKIKMSESMKIKWATDLEYQNNVKSNLKSWNKGKKGLQVAWNKGLTLNKIQCPFCGKFVDKGNAKRWHFDNCKSSMT